jgi:hypothetical protein
MSVFTFSTLSSSLFHKRTIKENRFSVYYTYSVQSIGKRKFTVILPKP